VPTTAQFLQNIIWHTLAGSHARYAAGTNDARRYAPGFSPILGFAELLSPNFAALARYCEPGEHFYTGGWSGPTPPGWRVDVEKTMFQMVWEGVLPPADPAMDAVPLGIPHAVQAMELAALTRPGPFGLRTIELGDYYGYFDGARLAAMAGERMHAGTLREISGVCTHPELQGRGFARRLVTKLIRRQMQRGETPFLHVMSDNESAHDLYLRMGFRDVQQTVVRVVSRLR
jgi:ribosomal protein S18 acetylase RimI-like enzyme